MKSTNPMEMRITVQQFKSKTTPKISHTLLQSKKLIFQSSKNQKDNFYNESQELEK